MQAVKNFDHIPDPFDFSEIADMHNQFLVGPRQERSLFGVRGAVPVHFHKIGNHLNGSLDSKKFNGFLAEAFRHSGNRVGVFDAEGNRRGIRGVPAHQSNVRAVEGGHYGDVDAAVGQNLFGHVGRVGVGDGVVHVEEVQFFPHHRVHHFAGQGQFVRLVLKKRIVVDVDFVVVNIALQHVQANRLAVGNEVDIAALPRHPGAQLRGDDPTPPEGGITNDAYFHGFASLDLPDLVFLPSKS